MNNFAIIGHGRVGATLCALLKEAGFAVAWLMSSQSLHQYTCPVYRTIPDNPHNAGIIFLCVPDNQIARMAEEMANSWGDQLQSCNVFHMSGLLTSSVLEPLARHGAHVASLHPLQSILQPQTARNTLAGAFFTVEGSEQAAVKAQDIVAALGATLLPIRREDKILYHSAAVIASNHLVTLISQAEDMFEGIGLKRMHMLPLIQATVENIKNHGRNALTGPVKRGDWATIENHICALAQNYPDHLMSYLSMATATARLCGRAWPEHIQPPSKRMERAVLAEHIARLKQRGMHVVFTNGCFDILHAGHVDYLTRARTLGDYLVVGLNADASVRRLKGPTRPVNDQEARAKVLAALACIDAVTIFEEDTPLELIRMLRPQTLVKGGDWRVEDIVGADIVTADGGKVLTIPFTDGFSTTNTIEKLKT